MPDSEDETSQHEQDGTNKHPQDIRRPRTRSLRSWRSGRSRTQSRPTSRPASLSRIYSAGFHDDPGVYFEPGDFAAESSVGNTEENAEKAVESEKQSEREEELGLEEVETDDHEPTAEKDEQDRATENGNLEKAASLSRQPTGHSIRSRQARDPNMVSWNGSEDPENPKNWKMKRKWLATMVVSCFVRFFAPLSALQKPISILTTMIRLSSPRSLAQWSPRLFRRCHASSASPPKCFHR